MFVGKEGTQKWINGEHPSALVAVSSQVGITACGMGLGAGQYGDLLGVFVTNGTWRMFSGECVSVRRALRGM